MRNRILVVGFLYAGFPLLSMAQHDHGDHAAGAPKPAVQSGHDHAGHDHAAKPAAAPALSPGATLKQTTCPVSGEPIKADSFTTYEGQKVFFCCNDCIDKLKQAPAKYLPALYKQIYPQRIQATCPVMGGAVDPEVFVEHEGQKVYFCCDGCDKKFKADPAKYVAKLKESYTTQMHCPVTGNPVDLAQSLEEKDRTVYFSSKESLAKYKADPKKYAEALLPEVEVVAYGRTAKDDIVSAPACPADQTPHKRGEVKSVAYQGKVYFLSSDSCAAAFKADPAKAVKSIKTSPATPPSARAQSSATSHRSLLPGSWDQAGHAGHDTAAGHGTHVAVSSHAGHGAGSAGCGGCQ